MTAAEYNICVSQVGPNLLRFVDSNLRQLDASKDVVQDAFLVLWNKRADVEISKAKSFLFSTAHHKLIDYIRKNKRVNPIEDMEFSSGGSSAETQMSHKDLVQKSLQAISTKYRTLITLRDLEGYSYREIESITGLSQSKVKVYIYRARKELKTAIIKLEASYGN